MKLQVILLTAVLLILTASTGFNTSIADNSGPVVYGYHGGQMSPHPGQIQWDPDIHRLEIDVQTYDSGYDVWIEKDWVDSHIPFFGVLNHSHSLDTYQSEEFHVVNLSGTQTPTTIIAQPHVKIRSDYSLYSDDPFMEKVGINISSLQYSLNSGLVPVTILGESFALEAFYAPRVAIYQDDNGDNQTNYTVERYKLNNSDPDDPLEGEIFFSSDGHIDIDLRFTDGENSGTYLGNTSNEHFIHNNQEYQAMVFYDPVNFSIEMPVDHVEDDEGLPGPNPWSAVVAHDINYRVVLDGKARQFIIDREFGGIGQTHSAVCEKVDIRVTLTSPFGREYQGPGVDMEQKMCTNMISLNPTGSIFSTFDNYKSASNWQFIGIDVVLFLTAPDNPFTNNHKGVADQGPEYPWSPDNPGRYALVNIADSAYSEEDRPFYKGAKVLINHELGHTLRAKHRFNAEPVHCSRVLATSTGTTLMGGSDVQTPIVNQYCFEFSNQYHHGDVNLCGEDYSIDHHNSARIACGSLIYHLDHDKWW